MRHCYVLRVFTRDAEGGNHLGVITDTVGLDTDLMQEIAADLGFSETTFVEWSDGGVPNVRIFTPGSEMPFAGHPMVGTGWLLGTMGPGGLDSMTCEVGPVEFEASGDRCDIVVSLGQGVQPIAAPDVVPDAVSSRLVAMPLPYYVVELADADAVGSFQVDEASLRSADIDFLYVYAWTDNESAKARFFAPGVGIFEDPATGSAAVALAAAQSVEASDTGSLTIDQGRETGFPSSIAISWAEGRARLGGTVRRDEVRVLDK